MALTLLYPFYCLLLLLLLPFSTTAQTYSNISLGSSLTAQNDNSSWVSPYGEFAFGFQPIGNDGFLLAVWFEKIPERTIVWSANGNNLVQGGSKVELTADGQLVVNDPKGNQIWSAAVPGTGVAYAAMLDTGNFVLATRDSVNLWESFNQTTDTILPTQTMNQGSMLIARYMETNYSTGRFQFTLEPDGNLHLYNNHYPLETPNFAYWPPQSSTGSIGDGFQVIFNQSGYIYLVAENGSILNMVFSDAASTQDFYQRATIDYDGVFRHYVYPKSTASSAGRWPMAWSVSSFIPSNICLSFTAIVGSGACGFNSYCTLAGNDQKPSCLCPPHYTFLDPNDVSRGCMQNFVQQNCEEALLDADRFEFIEMPNTDWPNSAYEYYNPVNEDWCRQACLTDCYCSVAIFRDGYCWKEKLPLMNGKIDASSGGKALIKVRKDNSTLIAGSCSKKDQSTSIRIASVLLGSSIFLILLLLVTIFVFFLGFSQRKPNNVMSAITLQSFTYNELEQATGGFKEELGSGAFGTVYKGVLEVEGGEFIAVKKLDKMEGGCEQDFKAEVSAIGRTNHKNLVRLMGFCNEGKHRLLVYEYMSNGSLADALFGNSRPNWYKRMQIAFGTARGLFYLHEECNTQIIHCDIKPPNILLDDSLSARISDFGIAKLLKTDQTRTTTAIRGTKGYMAPEWFKNMPITAKVDVYSFGILLLELICCRKNFEMEVKEENQMILADWAYDCYKERKLDLLVENDAEAMDDLKRAEKFVMIAIWCIQVDPSLRPTMKKVTQMMEGAVEVSIPPDPTSFFSSI